MTRPSARAAAAAALWLCLRVPAAAAQEPPEAFRLEGSFKTVAAASFNYDNERLFSGDAADGFSHTVLRLIASGTPSERLAFEVHAVQNLALDTVAGQLAANPALPGRGPHARRFTATDASWAWAEGGDARAELFLDRANVRLALGHADLTLGRQAVSFSGAWFWNPLDVFLPLDTRSIDRDYRSGVDAVRLDLQLGSLSGITVAGVAGRAGADDAASWGGSSLIGRAFAAGGGWDGAVQGGRIPGGYLAGASLAGEAAGVGLRFEAAHTWEDRTAPVPAVDHWAAVVAAAGSLTEAVSVEAEYLYNGAGDPNDLPASLGRFLGGSSLQVGRHLVGAIAWFRITPLLRGSTSWIRSLSDSSDLARAGLTLSLSDETDLHFGALLPRGRRPEGLAVRSEFGAYPALAYLELQRSF